MEIVINIPDNVFKRLVTGEVKYGGITARIIFNLVKKGTPLPKGHGRLIDADAVLVEPFGNTYKDIDIAETIIEADKEE